MRVAQLMENDFSDNPESEDLLALPKRFRAVCHQAKMLMDKLDKLEDDEIIRFKNVDIHDPNVDQDYAFMFWNENGMQESHEVVFLHHGFNTKVNTWVTKQSESNEAVRAFVKRIVVQLRYLFGQESKLRRDMKLK